MIREEIWRKSELAFTVPEVSALLDVSERWVRKEIELGVLPGFSPPRLGFESVVSLLVFNTFEHDWPLSTAGRKNLYAAVRNSLLHWHPGDREPDDLVLQDGLVRVQVKRYAHDAHSIVETFMNWKDKRVSTDPKILGGEPVFKGSRLSVRHIGGLPDSEKLGILEDYPYLSDEDIHFARVFSRAYPRMGRPRESSKAPR